MRNEFLEDLSFEFLDDCCRMRTYELLFLGSLFDYFLTSFIALVLFDELLEALLFLGLLLLVFFRFFCIDDVSFEIFCIVDFLDHISELFRCPNQGVDVVVLRICRGLGVARHAHYSEDMLSVDGRAVRYKLLYHLLERHRFLGLALVLLSFLLLLLPSFLTSLLAILTIFATSRLLF